MKLRRFFSLLLALVLVLGMCPVSAFATDSAEATETAEPVNINNGNWKVVNGTTRATVSDGVMKVTANTAPATYNYTGVNWTNFVLETEVTFDKEYAGIVFRGNGTHNTLFRLTDGAVMSYDNSSGWPTAAGWIGCPVTYKYTYGSRMKVKITVQDCVTTIQTMVVGTDTEWNTIWDHYDLSAFDNSTFGTTGTVGFWTRKDSALQIYQFKVTDTDTGAYYQLWESENTADVNSGTWQAVRGSASPVIADNVMAVNPTSVPVTYNYTGVNWKNFVLETEVTFDKEYAGIVFRGNGTYNVIFRLTDHLLLMHDNSTGWPTQTGETVSAPVAYKYTYGSRVKVRITMQDCKATIQTKTVGTDTDWTTVYEDFDLTTFNGFQAGTEGTVGLWTRTTSNMKVYKFNVTDTDTGEKYRLFEPADVNSGTWGFTRGTGTVTTENDVMSIGTSQAKVIYAYQGVTWDNYVLETEYSFTGEYASLIFRSNGVYNGVYHMYKNGTANRHLGWFNQSTAGESFTPLKHNEVSSYDYGDHIKVRVTMQDNKLTIQTMIVGKDTDWVTMVENYAVETINSELALPGTVGFFTRAGSGLQVYQFDVTDTDTGAKYQLFETQEPEEPKEPFAVNNGTWKIVNGAATTAIADNVLQINASTMPATYNYTGVNWTNFVLETEACFDTEYAGVVFRGNGTHNTLFRLTDGAVMSYDNSSGWPAPEGFIPCPITYSYNYGTRVKIKITVQDSKATIQTMVVGRDTDWNTIYENYDLSTFDNSKFGTTGTVGFWTRKDSALKIYKLDVTDTDTGGTYHLFGPSVSTTGYATVIAKGGNWAFPKTTIVDDGEVTTEITITKPDGTTEQGDLSLLQGQSTIAVEQVGTYEITITAADALGFTTVKTMKFVSIDVAQTDALPAADLLDVDFVDGTATDKSAAQNELVLLGSPVILKDAQFNKNVGVFNGEYDAYTYTFDAGEYALMSDGFTMEGIFSFDDTTSYAIFSGLEDGGMGFGVESGKLTFTCNITDVRVVKLQADINANEWYHAVATFDGQTVKLYVNGILAAEQAAAGTVQWPAEADAQQFVIGGDAAAVLAENYAPGRVSLARLYSQSMTDQQVTVRYMTLEPVIIEIPVYSASIDVNEPCVVPAAFASNGTAVSVAITDPNGDSVTVTDGEFTPTIQGEYTITYTANGSTTQRVLVCKCIDFDNPPVTLGLVATEQAASGGVFGVSVHMNRDGLVDVGQATFTLTYDPNLVSYANCQAKVGNLTVTDDGAGNLNMVYTGIVPTSDFIEYAATRLVRLYFKSKVATEDQIANFAFTNVVVDTKTTNIIAEPITVKLVGQSTLDLNGDGLIGAGDVALAETLEQKMLIAQASAIYPYKHVVAITMDGAGVCFRPDMMYYTTSTDIVPTLTDDPEIMALRNNPYAMALFNEYCATSYSALSETPTISGQNYTALIHGKEFATALAEYQVTNPIAWRFYYPDFGKDVAVYPSVFKAVGASYPNRMMYAWAEWKPITDGIIEPDAPVSNYYSSYSGGNMQNIANLILSENWANTSYVYMQSDWMDHYGHTYGYYTTSYYEDLTRYDSYFKAIMDALEATGTKDETLVIFTTDHGGQGLTHGGVTDAEYDVQIALGGQTIDSGKRLEGGTNHDLPVLALTALRGEVPSRMDGTADVFNQATLTQQELVKKQRNVEVVTAVIGSADSTMELRLSNVQSGNVIKSLDMVIDLQGHTVAGIETVGTVLRQTESDGKLYLTIAYEETCEVLAKITFSGDVCNAQVEEYMLGTAEGKEIYGDLVVTTSDKYAQVEPVVELIDAIGEVTLESKAAIKAARSAYDALTDEQKEWVVNGYVLEAAEATYQEISRPVISQQVNLNDALTMQFYIVPNAVTSVNMTVAGETTSYELSTLTPNSDGQYVISVKLAAAQMTENIRLQFMDHEEVILEKDYSVRSYADAVLTGNYSDRTMNLVKWMLNYGAKAQLYFGVNTDNLANAGYELDDTILPTEYEEMSTSGSISGLNFYGASLVFKDKIAVRFYFTGSVDGVSFGDYEVVAKGDMHYVEVAGINPQDYSNLIALTATKGEEALTVSYSPLNYILRMNEKGSDSLKALLNAMYGYHEAAVLYVNEIQCGTWGFTRGSGTVTNEDGVMSIGTTQAKVIYAYQGVTWDNFVLETEYSFTGEYASLIFRSNGVYNGMYHMYRNGTANRYLGWFNQSNAGESFTPLKHNEVSSYDYGDHIKVRVTMQDNKLTIQTMIVGKDTEWVTMVENYAIEDVNAELGNPGTVGFFTRAGSGLTVYQFDVTNTDTGATYSAV